MWNLSHLQASPSWYEKNQTIKRKKRSYFLILLPKRYSPQDTEVLQGAWSYCIAVSTWKEQGWVELAAKKQMALKSLILSQRDGQGRVGCWSRLCTLPLQSPGASAVAWGTVDHHWAAVQRASDVLGEPSWSRRCWCPWGPLLVTVTLMSLGSPPGHGDVDVLGEPSWSRRRWHPWGTLLVTATLTSLGNPPGHGDVDILGEPSWSPRRWRPWGTLLVTVTLTSLGNPPGHHDVDVLGSPPGHRDVDHLASSCAPPCVVPQPKAFLREVACPAAVRTPARRHGVAPALLWWLRDGPRLVASPCRWVPWALGRTVSLYEVFYFSLPSALLFFFFLHLMQAFPRYFNKVLCVLIFFYDFVADFQLLHETSQWDRAPNKPAFINALFYALSSLTTLQSFGQLMLLSLQLDPCLLLLMKGD